MAVTGSSPIMPIAMLHGEQSSPLTLPVVWQCSTTNLSDLLGAFDSVLPQILQQNPWAAKVSSYQLTVTPYFFLYSCSLFLSGQYLAKRAFFLHPLQSGRYFPESLRKQKSSSGLSTLQVLHLCVSVIKTRPQSSPDRAAARSAVASSASIGLPAPCAVPRPVPSEAAAVAPPSLPATCPHQGVHGQAPSFA